MYVEYHRWHSPTLGHDMELKLYGHGGQPVLAFPSLNGRFYDFEDRGMVAACAHLIEGGRLTLYTIDGIDWQSWTNESIPPADRARRHDAYDAYVVGEVAPFVEHRSGRPTMWTTGCSMGAYHAANLLFRHPDRFDGVVAISGLYQVGEFVGDAGGMSAYFNSPLWYLPGLEDPAALERLRRAKIVLVVGQGAWEDECVRDTRAMERVLTAKGIPAIVDYWGHDVEHDWPSWQRMLPHELERLGV